MAKTITKSKHLSRISAVFSQMLNRLAKRTEPNKLLFMAELIAGGKEAKPKMDELVKPQFPISG
jgi:hypothetical protein